MAIYIIPTSSIEKLTKRIKHIQNKGADITFNIEKEVIKEHKLSSGAMIAIKCTEVEVEGQYKINDWSFVGTIEHSSSGNIVRSINTSLEGKIPEKYRTVGQECEHCHQIRDRKDTYLIYNEKTQEFKQVGRTCLKGYTGGLDAERCARFADIFSYLFELENPDEYGDINGFLGGAVELSTESIKKTVIGYVKSYGYIPKESAHELAQHLFNAKKDDRVIKDATDAEVVEMNTWVDTVNTSSDYMWNAKTAWKKSTAEYRDIALLASFVTVYLKTKGEEIKRVQTNSKKSTEYVGNVGDRITVKDIKSIRILYTKDGSRYAYNAPDVDVIEIIDEQGHIFIWSTANYLLDDFEKSRLKEIVATVKEHKEYKGLKQTVITRGKVILNDTKKSEPSTEPVSKTEKSSGGVDDVFKALNSILD